MKLFLIVLIAVVLAGCSQTSQWVTKIDAQNAEISRKLAKDFLSTWRINSGFIRGALAEKIAELPQGAVSAMDQLDALALEDPAKLDDFKLGMSLGLRVRMLSQVVQSAIKIYAPEILQFVPSVLAL